ncbi:MAG: hypothetical protein OEZ34_09690 [Spirochaetia bacterium]|nr:hypothetical protein [Spirochaetia bacterium]
MGNDEQIDQFELDRGKTIFLPPEISDVDGAGMIKYSLDEEYKKSKKNFAWKVYFILFVFVCTLGLLAFASHLYFLYIDSKKEIVVTEFEGENLKEVLTSTRTAEKNLADSREELKNLHEKMKREIAAIRAEGEKKREEIKNKDITSKEKSKLISSQRNEENNQVDAVTLKYEKLIDEKESEIASNEIRVKESREKMDEGIFKASSKLSNAEKLTRMRLDKQKDHYNNLMRQMIATYDPTFKNRRAKRILRGVFDRYSSGEILESHSRTMRIDGGISEAEYDRLKERSSNFKILMAEARKIPYKHSMKPALRHMDAFHQSMVSQYDSLVNHLMRTGRARKAELNSYHHAFEHLTRINPETGYILDPQNQNAVMVYVNPVVRVEAGHRATVFRRDDEEIAVIEFLAGNHGNRAKVVSLTTGKNLQPFDRVLIKYKR